MPGVSVRCWSTLAAAATIIPMAGLLAQKPVKVADYRYATDNSAIRFITVRVTSNRHGDRIASVTADDGGPTELAFADVVRPAEDQYMNNSPDQLFPGAVHPVLLMQVLEDRDSDRVTWHCKSHGILHFGFEQAGSALPLDEFNPRIAVKVWVVVEEITASETRMTPCIHLTAVKQG